MITTHQIKAEEEAEALAYVESLGRRMTSAFNNRDLDLLLTVFAPWYKTKSIPRKTYITQTRDEMISLWKFTWEKNPNIQAQTLDVSASVSLRGNGGKVEAIDLMHMLEFTGAECGILLRVFIVGKFGWYPEWGWLCTSTEATDGCDCVRFDDSCSEASTGDGER